MAENKSRKNITVNRKARHEYLIIENYEAGIALQGTEVKSLRQNKASLADAYATIRNGEVWLLNCHINEYNFGNLNNHDPLRERKLLLNKREIKKLTNKINEKGFTLIPLSLYFTRGKVKVDLGVCKGKKVYDKRESIKNKDMQRDLDRNYKHRF